MSDPTTTRFEQELHDNKHLLEFLEGAGRQDLVQDVRDLIGRMMVYRASMQAANRRKANASAKLQQAVMVIRTMLGDRFESAEGQLLVEYFESGQYDENFLADETSASLARHADDPLASKRD